MGRLKGRPSGMGLFQIVEPYVAKSLARIDS